MRKMLWVLLCALSATTACGQSAKDAVNAFRDSMKNGQFVLKNFSGEEDVRASWTGSALELDPPRWRTMGVLTIDSVKLKGHMLEMRCARHVAVRDESDKIVLYQRPSEMKIEVDLGSADPATALPQVKESLFYPSVELALAALPKTVQQVIPARLDRTAPKVKDVATAVNPRCNCAERDCKAGIEEIKGVVPPKFLRGADPGYSEKARKAKLNGSVNVRLIVDKSGRPTDVWIARPVGMGLDEEAAKSVLTYQFRPATCHGSPVGVYLAVEVNFEIH
ncbi:MAG TPA: energy transducer TonB [Bryocella sp.]|nr:energy transducer TonB [Bryocella sp.]